MLVATFRRRLTRTTVICASLLCALFYFFSARSASDNVAQPAISGSGIAPNGEDIKTICESLGFHPFQQRSGARPRKIYDLFLLSTELDWLEIRLNTLAPYVDYFVIVESPTTFTGMVKPLYLQDNWSNFSAFHGQMIHRVVEDPGVSVGTRTWDHEDYMRNALLDHVFPTLTDDAQIPQLDDVLVVSDIDELPKPAALQTLRHCIFPPRLTLRSDFYYYSFQWRSRGPQWPHPQATVWRGADSTLRPQALRIGEGGPGNSRNGGGLAGALRRWRESASLYGAAWHCSSCFATLAEMQAKMQSFSHTSYNTPKNRDPDTIVSRVRAGLDLFGRPDLLYDRIEGNTDVPGYVAQDPERFAYMLDRDGEDAAFSDYRPSS